MNSILQINAFKTTYTLINRILYIYIAKFFYQNMNLAKHT